MKQPELFYVQGVGLQGFLCTQDGENHSFKHCFEECKSKCHPLPLLKALASEGRVEIGAYSVTELLNPPRIIYFKRNKPYYQTPEQLVWMTFGSAWHNLVEGQEDKQEYKKIREKLTMDNQDVILKGRVDYYDAETKTLWDFKTIKEYWLTSVQKHGWKDTTYDQQLNMYRAYGFPEAEYLKIEALIKDWVGGKWTKKGWVKTKFKPIETVDVPMMPIEEVKSFVTEALRVVLKNQVDPLTIRDCTAGENWGSKRCFNYCPIKEYCSQFIAILAKKTERELNNVV